MADNNEWEELLDEEYEAFGEAAEPTSFDDEEAAAAGLAQERAARPGGPVPAGPASNPAEYFAEEHERKPMSAQERLAELVETMPGQTKTLVRIVGLCREARPADEVIETVAAWQKLNFSVFEPATLCGLLERAGGLARVNEDGTPYGDEAAATPAPGAPAGDDAPALQDDPGAPVPDDLGALDAAAGVGDEEDFDDTCAEPAPRRPLYWLATSAGLELVAAHDPRSHVAQMLADEAFYLPVYRELLERLADGPMTKKEIDAIVRANPITESPRRLGGYFVDRLERIEAIEWTGAWSLTDIGRELLENEALYQ